jgi:hypothetical protein
MTQTSHSSPTLEVDNERSIGSSISTGNMAVKSYNKLKNAIRDRLLRKLPPCQQAVEKISQSMEGKLTMRKSIDLNLHLGICAWCQRYIEQLNTIRESARVKCTESPDLRPTPTTALSNEARERIRRKLASEN